VAIFMGLATLMLLLAVSVPYVLTTQYQHAASVAYAERMRASAGARSAADHGLAMMSVMSRGNQYSGWRPDHEQGTPGDDSAYKAYNDPFVDGLDEFQLDLATDLAYDFPRLADPDAFGVTWGRRAFSARDDRSQVWSTRIEDEQGKVNLNTASPDLIGNILGSAVIADVKGNLSSLQITMAEGGANFPGPSGYFVVEGVLVRYRGKAGDDTFVNCAGMAAYNREELAWLRGSPPIFIEDQPTAEGRIRAGALAIPVAAWLLPWYRMIMTTDPSLPGLLSSADQVRLTGNLPIFSDDARAGAVQPSRWLATRDLFTVYSHGPSGTGWLHPQLTASVYGWDARASGQTMQTITIFAGDVPNPDWLQDSDPRRSPRGVPTGSLIRMRIPAGRGQATYRQAVSMGNRGRNETIVSSLVPLPAVVADSADRPIIEVLESTPININTAPFEVLVANMKGLRRGQNVIGQLEAETIATAIRYLMREERTGFRDDRYRRLNNAIVPPGIEDLRADQLMWGRLRNDAELGLFLNLLVEDKIIEGWAAQAVMLQQTEHGSPQSVVLAKWCYHSYGAVRIDGVATVYAPVGVDTARAHIREHALIGSDAPFTWEWLDASTMAATMARPAGNIFAHFTDATIARRTYGHVRLPVLLDPNAAWAGGPGDIRLGGGGASFRPAQGANGRGFFLNTFNFLDGTDREKTGARMTAGSMSFWHQWPSGARPDGRDAYIFDSGEFLGTNQMSLLWWDNGPFAGKLQQQKPGLTFRIADRTIERAFVAVKMRPDRNMYEPGEWYHYNLNWQGMELGGIGMTVDGRARLGPRSSPGVGVNSYAESDMIVQDENGRWVSRTTRLSQDVDLLKGQSISDTIEVEDAVHGFWPSQGVIRIGEEAIEYTITTARGFSGLTRGARGTPRPNQSFPDGGVYRRGQRVTVFGYSTHIVHDNTAPYLPRGGSDLADVLDGNGIYPVSVGAGTPQAGYFASELIGPRAGASKETGIIPIAMDAGVPRWGVYYLRGPAWRRYVQSTVDANFMVPEGTDLNLVGGGSPEYELWATAGPGVFFNGLPEAAEYVVAERVGNGLRIARRFDENFVEKLNQDEWYYFMGGPVNTRDANGAPASIAGMRIVPGDWTMSGSICVLCSVLPSSGGDYLNPLNFVNIDGNRIGNAIAHVQVGQGNFPQDYEWIQYSRLVDSPLGVMLAFTDSQSLSACASTSEGAIRNNRNANDPSSNKAAIATVISTPHRETNPRSNPGDPLYDPSATRFYRHLTTGPASPITPVFAVRGWVPGVNDRATVLQSPNNHAAGGIVRRVGGSQLVRTNAGTQILDRTRLMAFDRHHGRMFPAQPTSEVIKFPSAPLDLPTGIPADITFGRSNVVNLGGGGRVDELQTSGFASVRLFLGDPANSASQRLVVSSNGSFLPEEAGLIKVNDEYIAFRRVSQIQRDEYQYDPITNLPILDPNDNYRHVYRTNTYYELSDLTRGLFGSRVSDHGRWDGVMIVRGMNIGAINGTVPANQNRFELLLPRYPGGAIPGSANLPLIGNTNQPRFDNYGFVRVDPGWDAEESAVEIFGYNLTRPVNDGVALITGEYMEAAGMPLFRGQYGTTPRSWSGTGQRQPIVAQFAVREPDFFPGWMMRNLSQPGTPSPEISHIQGGETFRNSTPTKLRWHMDDGGVPGLRTTMGARLYVRFDGKAGWDSPIEPPRRGARPAAGTFSANLATDPTDRLHVFDFDWSGRVDTSRGEAAVVQEIDLSRLVTRPVDRIEWRVVFYFREGSYESGDWKGSLRFRGVAIDLSNETRVVTHEEVR